MSSRNDVGIRPALRRRVLAGALLCGDTLMLATICYVIATLLLIGGIIALVRKVCG